MLSELTLERRGRTFRFLQGSDGSTVWRRGDEGPAQTVHGLDRVRAMRDAELLPSWVFADTLPDFETIATGTIDGRPVVVLSTTAADGLEEHLHFDAADGLLLRRAYQAPTPLGPIPTDLDYSDWRAEAGVMIPHRIVTRQPGESTATTIDSVEPAPARAGG